ncbi:spoIVB peptidase [Firmicutes bacterium CAG:884]|nr:spoIVB peptidase [Firmicutes bacterium CAG:884]
MHLKKALIMLLLLVILPFNIYAYSDYIYAGGETVGIRVNSNGVLVVGTYSLDKKNKINLQVGDVINTINNKSISSSTDFIDSIKGKSVVSVGYIRGNKEYKTDLNIVLENGVYKSGLYVKDSITGIGTLTYIDPQTRLFGALGHEIIEKTTGKLFNSNSGSIFESTITGITVSSRGIPGSKNARYYSDSVLGSVFENTNKGIFGNYTGKIANKKLYKVASFNEIKTGNAKILTVLDGTKVEEFDITIERINKGDIKNILFEISDKNLIKKTGGIVQGMSGSPIIQDDKIIGAVTHVIIDNPIKGYGVYIGSMLEEAEN